jgi:hypothetical protein
MEHDSDAGQGAVDDAVMNPSDDGRRAAETARGGAAPAASTENDLSATAGRDYPSAVYGSVLAATVVVSAGDLAPATWPCCCWSAVWCSGSRTCTRPPSPVGTAAGIPARSGRGCATSGPLPSPRCHRRSQPRCAGRRCRGSGERGWLSGRSTDWSVSWSVPPRTAVGSPAPVSFASAHVLQCRRRGVRAAVAQQFRRPRDRGGCVRARDDGDGGVERGEQRGGI